MSDLAAHSYVLICFFDIRSFSENFLRSQLRQELVVVDLACELLIVTFYQRL